MRGSVVHTPDATSAAGAAGLGRLPAERVRAWRLQVLAALLAQAGSVLLMVCVVALGHADAMAVTVWAPLSMLFSAGVWLALARGWTAHLRDPALTAPQIVWSIGSAVVCYALAGPLRLLAVPMACLALVFSIFALPARQVQHITVATLLAFGVVMAVLAQLQPHRYPPVEELLVFGLLLFSIPPIALLAGRLSELRARLGQQRRELAEALARIQELAVRDELTGLFNRRHMHDVLKQAQARAWRGRPFAVALLDIDHFKLVNDRHGHAVGDEVLRLFANVASHSVRSEDTVGRWGGEEFVVVFDDAQADAVAALAERLRQRVAAAQLPLADGSTLSFTASIGLVMHRPGELPEATLERADRLLYQAKARGRDRLEAQATMS